MGEEEGVRAGLGGARLVMGYAALLVFLGIAIAVSLSLGSDREHAPPIGGTYDAEASSCFGESFELDQSGVFVDIHGTGESHGKLRFEDGRLTGSATCADGSSGDVDLAVTGTITKDEADASLSGEIAGQEFAAAAPDQEEAVAAAPGEPRGAEETFARLMLAIGVVILAARLVGTAVAKIGQPRVMGEVLAGILLGPTLLGAIAPGVMDYLFPPDIIPLVAAAASVGLAFYLFIVGMELEPSLIRERVGAAAFISNTSVAFPLALGFLIAVPLYEILAPDADYLPFALFAGVSMSVTAFPVLARILVERRMLKSPVGALAMAGAAIDDVTAWGLLALATAVAGSATGYKALWVIAAAAGFTALLLLVGRPLLARVSKAYDEVGRVPTLWLGTIFVSVLFAAYVAGEIGIAPIFGAFLVGLIMPRYAGLTDDVRGRLEDFVVIVLLPLFFVVTGLRTEINALNRWELWAITALLIVVAIVGKWVGAALAARFCRFSWRESNVIGALMNTRGLTELIVLNIGLNQGLISTQLFTMLVVMALVTTFMAGPALKLIDPHGRFTDPPEAELPAVVRGQAPDRHSVVVVAQDSRNIDALLALAVPVSQSDPPRDLIVTRLLVPERYATGIGRDDLELQRATNGLRIRREALEGSGIKARVAAYTTPDPGGDIVRLAEEESVDIVFVDGRRPLIGEGVPKGAIGEALESAASDVAVLVEREGGEPQIDETRPVVVPFGGAEHDWAALELAVWIAAANNAPLRLLGSTSAGPEERDASKLLASASLAVQQLSGVMADPVLVEPGALLEAARDAGLLVVGLSERWREEGLGELRAGIVKNAPVTTVLVRRGRRPGVLAPKADVTRLRWSMIAPPVVVSPARAEAQEKPSDTPEAPEPEAR